MQTNYPVVLAAIETGRATDALWRGFERLTLLALSGTQDHRASLPRDLLLTAGRVAPPTEMRDLVQTLAQRTRR